jgi:hypothetical protein
MAIVATVVLEDSLNTQVTKRYEMEATTLSQALTDIGILAPLLLAITELGIISVTFSTKSLAEASPPASGSNVDTGATFRLRLTDGTVASHKIPGFPIAKVGGNRSIDPTDSDVVAYFGNFLAAGAFTLSDGETMAADGILSGTFDV